MCGLCALLAGASHWAEKSSETPRPSTPRAERMKRVEYLNRILAAYACSIADWHGTTYVLSTFTGKTEIVSDLADVWHQVERLTGVRPDPLALRRTGPRIVIAHADH